MAEKPTATARELAARALCRHDKNPENTTYKGKPMWMDYLDAADAVLKAIGWEEPDYIPVYRMREVKSEE